MRRRDTFSRDINGKDQDGPHIAIRVYVTNTGGLTRDEANILANRLADDAMRSIAAAPYSTIPLSHVKVSRYPY